ncbi:MAG TPA: hypothetical protein VFF68_01255, partial [Anaerolineaceae bacterium]|nr:hypothetical protein [Anaerolineaceae bacterium]
MKTIVLRIVSIVLILSAILLTGWQWLRFSEVRSLFPAGQVIASVPVGGLDRTQAGERIAAAYQVPVEMSYLGNRIQVGPETLGFTLRLEEMLAAAEAQWKARPSLPAFWDYLWNRTPPVEPVPLDAVTDANRLTDYLAGELVSRYDLPPLAGRPQPPDWSFSAPQDGRGLVLAEAVARVEEALVTLDHRLVELPVAQTAAPERPVDDLAWLMKHRINRSGFTGVAEVYFEDLQTRETVSFALQYGSDIEPGVAFTAASTMKLPIMVATMRREAEPAPEEIGQWFERMIVYSENPPADRLMERLDSVRGPLLVTED